MNGSRLKFRQFRVGCSAPRNLKFDSKIPGVNVYSKFRLQFPNPSFSSSTTMQLPPTHGTNFLFAVHKNSNVWAEKHQRLVEQQDERYTANCARKTWNCWKTNWSKKDEDMAQIRVNILFMIVAVFFVMKTHALGGLKLRTQNLKGQDQVSVLNSYGRQSLTQL